MSGKFMRLNRNELVLTVRALERLATAETDVVLKDLLSALLAKMTRALDSYSQVKP